MWVLHPNIQQVKFSQGWKGPFHIVKVLNEVNYVVQKSRESRLITVHIDHIKTYNHMDVPERW